MSDGSSDVCASDLPSTPAYASRYLPVIGDAHPRRRVLPWALPSPEIGRGLKRYCCIASAAFNVTPCATDPPGVRLPRLDPRPTACQSQRHEERPDEVRCGKEGDDQGRNRGWA